MLSSGLRFDHGLLNSSIAGDWPISVGFNQLTKNACPSDLSARRRLYALLPTRPFNSTHRAHTRPILLFLEVAGLYLTGI